MYKYLKEKLIRRKMKDIKKNQLWLLEIKKNVISGLKISVDKINIRLGTAEEKIRQPVNVAIKLIQDKPQREKRLKENRWKEA